MGHISGQLLSVLDPPFVGILSSFESEQAASTVVAPMARAAPRKIRLLIPRRIMFGLQADRGFSMSSLLFVLVSQKGGHVWVLVRPLLLGLPTPCHYYY